MGQQQVVLGRDRVHRANRLRHRGRRAEAILDEARALAPVAVTDPAVQKLQLPKLPAWLRRRRRTPAAGTWAPPGYAPASFLPGQVGSPGYSPVDPRWGPPKG